MDGEVMTREQAERILAGQERIEAALKALVDRQATKDWYTTEEFGKLIGKAEITVREHCRYGRIAAKKCRTGRGPHASWAISHEELLRYQRDGLMPDVRLAISRTPA